MPSFLMPATFWEHIFGPSSGPYHHLLASGLFFAVALISFAIAVVTKSFTFFLIGLGASGLMGLMTLGGFVGFIVSFVGTLGIGLSCIGIAVTMFAGIWEVKTGFFSFGIVQFIVMGVGLVFGFFGVVIVGYGFYLLGPSRFRLFFDEKKKNSRK